MPANTVCVCDCWSWLLFVFARSQSSNECAELRAVGRGRWPKLSSAMTPDAATAATAATTAAVPTRSSGQRLSNLTHALHRTTVSCDRRSPHHHAPLPHRTAPAFARTHCSFLRAILLCATRPCSRTTSAPSWVEAVPEGTVLETAGALALAVAFPCLSRDCHCAVRSTCLYCACPLARRSASRPCLLLATLRANRPGASV